MKTSSEYQPVPWGVWGTGGMCVIYCRETHETALQRPPLCYPHARSAVPGTVPGSSSHPDTGLPRGPHPSPPQVLEHQQQHGLLVDPPLPCVPGHPGEPSARGFAHHLPWLCGGWGCVYFMLTYPSLSLSAPLQINFFIFIRIIQILVSKLRAHQMRYTDYKFRWAVGAAPALRAHMQVEWCPWPWPCAMAARSVQAGQVHADADPFAGHPRGGLRFHHG